MFHGNWVASDVNITLLIVALNAINYQTSCRLLGIKYEQPLEDHIFNSDVLA